MTRIGQLSQTGRIRCRHRGASSESDGRNNRQEQSAISLHDHGFRDATNRITPYREKSSSPAISSDALGSKVAGARSVIHPSTPLREPSAPTRLYRKTDSISNSARPLSSPLNARVSVTGHGMPDLGVPRRRGSGEIRTRVRCGWPGWDRNVSFTRQRVRREGQKGPPAIRDPSTCGRDPLGEWVAEHGELRAGGADDLGRETRRARLDPQAERNRDDVGVHPRGVTKRNRCAPAATRSDPEG